jgi:hypothetical protein
MISGALLLGQGLRIAYDKSKNWDSVRYPQGNIAQVVPTSARAGDTVNVIFPEFCNDGVNITVMRWLEFLGPDGERIAAIELPDVQFFPKGPACFAPSAQPMTLPEYVAGRPPGDTPVRFRFDTIYIKPRQVVHEHAFSESFILLDSKTHGGS